MNHYTLHFAQAYGEGVYNEGTYSCTAQHVNDGTCVESGTTTPGGGDGGASGAGGGALADTGIAVLTIVSIACLLIFVALVVRIWHRPKPALQEATTFPPQSSDDSH
jgi:hypothetical protein